MKKKKLPIGFSDFKDVITGDYYYVDKTLFIKEVIDSGDKILLIPRPRRFGKTLNITMLKYFYDCCPDTWATDATDALPSSPETGPRSQNPNAYLFDSLAISRTGREYLDKMGKYPVIYLSFREIKDMEWESCLDSIKKLIQREYARHSYLLESHNLMAHEQVYFKKIIDLSGSKSDYTNSLESLLIFLNRFYNKRAVVLIDEYDTPVHSGYIHGYYDEIINFIRIFMGSGLKDTGQYLEKGIVTGIMRIAKESIFSDLNNLGVYTLLSEDFCDYFGFSETEVKTMLEDFNIPEMLDEVQRWYNGYFFGGKVIYNPWSIINFLRSKGKKLIPYWINTSDNKMVDSLLSRGDVELRKELEQLIRGESIEKAIDENIILKDIDTDEDSFWSYLLMGGYLKQTAPRPDSGRVFYTLSVPNEEVKTTYQRIIRRFFTARVEPERVEIMLKALIDGDIELFEEILREIVLKVFSYHDFRGEPEKVYHALVMGLLVWISGTHEIKSNRESGYGRYDIMIIPKDITKTGYVIEFKTVRKAISETVETATEKALEQIEEKKYETELIERGIQNRKKLAIVFNGKEVHVKQG